MFLKNMPGEGWDWIARGDESTCAETTFMEGYIEI